MTAHEALRPFAIVALETTALPDGAEIVFRVDGEQVATLSATDFRNAFAAYAGSDELCRRGWAATGGVLPVPVTDGWLKRYGVGLWCLFFFVIGTLVGAGNG